MNAWRKALAIMTGNQKVARLRNRVHVLEIAVADCVTRIRDEDPEKVRGLEALELLAYVDDRLTSVHRKDWDAR